MNWLRWFPFGKRRRHGTFRNAKSDLEFAFRRHVEWRGEGLILCDGPIRPRDIDAIIRLHDKRMREMG